MTERENIISLAKQKIMCSTKGSLHGGRAMCGYVIVGDKSCSLKAGKCDLQVGTTPIKVELQEKSDDN